MGTLRLLLAISVLLFHANASGIQLVGGGVAVESFFIISGFYMSLVLDTKYTGANGRYSLFIGNRLLKLYPAYWIVLLLALLMQLLVLLFTGHPIMVLYHIDHFQMNATGIVFLSFTNLAILGQDLVSFFGLDRNTGDLFFTADFMKTYPFLFNFQFIPQGWSLGIELMFYLVAPFLLRRKLYIIIVLMLLIVLLRYRLINVIGLHYDPWIFRFFPSQLLLFLAGNLSYRVYVWSRKKWHVSNLYVYIVLTVIITISVLYPYLPATLYNKYMYLLMVFLSLPILIQTQKTFRYDTFFGELSYPVYLSHMLVLVTIGTLNSQGFVLKSIPINLSTLVFTLLISILINRFVVKPIDRYRQSRVKTQPTQSYLP